MEAKLRNVVIITDYIKFKMYRRYKILRTTKNISITNKNCVLAMSIQLFVFSKVLVT